MAFVSLASLSLSELHPIYRNNNVVVVGKCRAVPSPPPPPSGSVIYTTARETLR